MSACMSDRFDDNKYWNFATSFYLCYPMHASWGNAEPENTSKSELTHQVKDVERFCTYLKDKITCSFCGPNYFWPVAKCTLNLLTMWTMCWVTPTLLWWVTLQKSWEKLNRCGAHKGRADYTSWNLHGWDFICGAYPKPLHYKKPSFINLIAFGPWSGNVFMHPWRR